VNYLAHLYLSFDNENIVVGNFMGDFVKGNQLQQYESQIQQGIKIHREIDHFTDNHPIIKQGRKRLIKDYRHYSGVIMDIYCDHFLAKNWERYADEELKNFSTRHYQLLNQHLAILPPRCQYLLSYMEAGDWLYQYQYMAGVQFALSGMASRTSFDSGMERATQNLGEYYEEFGAEFQEFFIEIVEHIHIFTAKIKFA